MKWINVKQRKPIEYRNVLVYRRVKIPEYITSTLDILNMCIAFWSARNNCWMVSDTSGVRILDDVTHWTPLPANPIEF